MASGILVNYGQQFIVDQIASYANDSGFYLGLMTNHNTPSPLDAQLPTDIEEITGTSYQRQHITSWTIYSGVDPYIQGSQVTFNVSGTWSNVYGYFLSLTISGNDAIATELFPTAYGGDKIDGDIIKLTPKLEVKDDSE